MWVSSSFNAASGLRYQGPLWAGVSPAEAKIEHMLRRIRWRLRAQVDGCCAAYERPLVVARLAQLEHVPDF